MHFHEQIECGLADGARRRSNERPFESEAPLDSRRIKSRLKWTGPLRPLLLLILLNPSGSAEALIQVPNRHTVASIPGDLVLGLLVPVHERPSPKQAQTRTCGAVREQYGIQRVESAFRTIDSINADPNILPNITLGIEVRDSCWHSPIALEQSIEFIRDAMAASEQPQYLHAGLQQQQVALAGGLRPARPPAGATGSGGPLESAAGAQAASINSTSAAICAPYLRQQQQQLTGQKKIKNLVGVVGPASSGDTVQVQNLLQLFNMPQVGYSATSRDLSNKNFFKYFLRVVPSDKLQAQVLIDLMMAHNWTYITVVYTEGSYGSSLMNAFRERAQEVGICFATLESMPPNADDGKFDELIEAIRNHQNARVVVCMCEGRTIGRLFAGFKRQSISNEYLIIGSDGWSDRFDVVEKQEEIALGGISIRIHSAYVHDFDDYYFALNPFTNHRNPWFAEFWEQRFQCNLEYPASAAQSTSGQQQQQASQQHSRPAFIRPANAKVYNRTCSGKESLRQNHKQDAKMAFVQKSIITMALGLDSMQRTICGPNRPGLCAEMLPVNGSIFLQHLMNVSFSFLNEEVYFDEQGDPPGKYEILNFKRKSRTPSELELDFDSTSSFSSSQSPSESDPELSYEHFFAHGDYSNDRKQSGKLPGGKKEGRRQKGTEKRPANYDSYSTLRVYSTSAPPWASANRTGVDSTAASGKAGRREQRQTAGVPPSPLSDYSATSDYEYVLVGSWKSTDGLSLFGKIHWPARSWLFNQHHFAGGNSPASSTVGAGLAGPGSGANASGAADAQDLATTLTSAGPPTRGRAGNGSLLTAVPPEPYEPYESGDDIPPPKSVCSLPCAKGHAKKIQSDSVKCCWVCVPCRPREYLFNEFKCKACDKGWWPNADQTGCDQIPIEYLDWRSLEALVSISIAIFGLLLTLLTALVFIKHNDTPVVKSTTRELSYMILFAMLLCYINTFFLVTKPSKLACFVSRCLPGASFAMMYGALVTKTNRIARILAGSKKKIITRRPHFMSATAQVTITWLIVLLECVIIVSMLIKEPADKTHEYPSDERVVLVCNTTTMGVIAPLGFDFFLIAMCTLYAFKTRNVPENFNEAKFIGFTMYTTLVIWVAFVVIYLSSEHKVTTLCLCISFSALFALFLLFFPRCYIILFKPEKNNRSYFTTIKNVRCHIGYQMHNAQASSNSSGAALALGANHHSNLNGSNSAKLGAQLHNQFQFPNAGSLNSSHKAIAGKRPLLSAANAPPSSGLFEALNNHAANMRSPTSGHQVAPLASLQLVGDAADGAEHDAIDRRRAERQLNLQRLADERGPKHSLGSLRLGPPDAGKPEAGVAADRPAPGSPDELLATGGTQQDSSREPLRQLLAHIRWAFGRRSRRKESDKTAIIQQHLRAIRHAENLDRQTNFRRSQVQRLVQRFDSNLAFPGPMLATAQNVLGQPPQMVQQFREFMGEQRDERLAELLAGDEARRLVSAMSQLIGHDNLLRLVQVLARFHEQRRQQQQEGHSADVGQQVELAAGKQEDEISSAALPPFDLRKQVDRRLALAWLRFLAQLAQKAIESIQMVAASARANSPARCELLLSPQALPQGDAADRADKLASEGELLIQTLACGGQDSRASCTNASQLGRSRDEYSNVTQLGSVDNERTEDEIRVKQRASDKLSGERPATERKSSERPALEQSLDSLRLNLRADNARGARQTSEPEDPIKRALERITGKSTTVDTSGAPEVPRQVAKPLVGQHSMRSARRLVKDAAHASQEERDTETRLRLDATTGQLEVASADSEQARQWLGCETDRKRAKEPLDCSGGGKSGGQQGRSSCCRAGAVCECCCQRRRPTSGERGRRSRRDGACASPREGAANSSSAITGSSSHHELARAARPPACCSASVRRDCCRRRCACCNWGCSASRSRSGHRKQTGPEAVTGRRRVEPDARPLSSSPSMVRIEARPPPGGRHDNNNNSTSALPDDN